MSNPNNFPYRDLDDAGESSDEAEENPTTIGSIYIAMVLVISVQRPTRLSQSVVDQRTIDPRDLTNPQINALVQRPFDYLRVAEPLASLVILILLSCLIYFCWPVLILAFLAYRRFVDNEQPTVPSRDSQSQYSTALFNHAFDPYRDAQQEGRTASPTHEEIEFSTTVDNPAPYGVQAALTTDLPLPPPNVDSTEHVNINPVIQNEVAVQRMTDALELINHQEETSQISPVVRNPLDPVPHNAGINQTDVVEDQSERANPGPVQNEVIEIEGNVHVPADGAHQALIPAIRLRSNSAPKLMTSACLNDATTR